MKATKLITIIMFLSVVLLLTGCWNSREINKQSIVRGMGIDKVQKTNEYRVTFQIIIPSSVSIGRKGGAGGIPVIVHSDTDHTLFGAMRKASQKVPRELFFAHIQYLIIGESMAKAGIGELFDFFERVPKFSLTSPILIARGTSADSVLRVLSPAEYSQAGALANKLALTSKEWGQSVVVELLDVIKALQGTGETAISGVRIVGDPKIGETKANLEHTSLPAVIKIEGIALFKGKKLNKWLDGEEARGTLWVQNKMKRTAVNIACKDIVEGTAVELIRSRTKVKVNMKDGHPVFRIRIDEAGVVNEVQCSIDLNKREEITNLQKQWAKETEEEVMKAVKVAQSRKSDIFGFGDAVRRSYPKLWKEIERKEKWPEMFAESKVEVEVKAFIRRTGMRGRPYFFKS
ncbi:Ger(x)C family spore germination protein [Paenibacillus solisilvae]|uniref:Ger(X)C family spore germination protein n=1 Tax=Paenibacillus solisilvae TaxID=2486751 RepID=A0ABW0W1N4_9BACL